MKLRERIKDTAVYSACGLFLPLLSLQPLHCLCQLSISLPSQEITVQDSCDFLHFHSLPKESSSFLSLLTRLLHSELISPTYQLPCGGNSAQTVTHLSTWSLLPSTGPLPLQSLTKPLNLSHAGSAQSSDILLYT